MRAKKWVWRAVLGGLVAAIFLLLALPCRKRAADLTDVAHVYLRAWDLGLLANVGPLVVGWEHIYEMSYDYNRELRLGLGGTKTVELKGTAWGVLVPCSRYEVLNGSQWYGNRGPAFGSVGLSVGCWYAVGFRVDLVELADFALGLLSLDPVGDDLEGETPLHVAVQSGSEEVVAQLLHEGANVDARDDDGGETPLNWACWLNYPGIAKLLLLHGADTSIRNRRSMAPLHLAAMKGESEIVDMLLKAGADPMVRNKWGNTPLHLASTTYGLSDTQTDRNARKAVVRLLLAAGADPNAKDADGKTPLDCAVREGLEDIAEILRQHKAEK